MTAILSQGSGALQPAWCESWRLVDAPPGNEDKLPQFALLNLVPGAPRNPDTASMISGSQLAHLASVKRTKIVTGQW
jgi:hypothetical protein